MAFGRQRMEGKIEESRTMCDDLLLEYSLIKIPSPMRSTLNLGHKINVVISVELNRQCNSDKCPND